MYEKKYNIFKKLLAYGGDFIYNADVVTLIALKREVAAVYAAGFPWSECQVLETGDKSLYKNNCPAKTGNNVWIFYDTHGSVYSHRLSYC